MSTTPSVLSCLHRMEVAMKQPVRPIPALRTKSWRGKGMEEGGEGENGWIGVLINAKSSLGKSDCKCSALVSIVKNSSKNEKKTHKQATFLPAMDNYRAGGGQGFLSGPFYFLHQFQKRWSLVWSLLIRPRGVPVLPQTTLLFPALCTHTHTH